MPSMPAATIEPTDTARISAQIRVLRIVALVSLALFLACDVLLATAQDVTTLALGASIAAMLFFLVMLYALVRWAYLHSRLHEARVDAELDAAEREQD